MPFNHYSVIANFPRIVCFYSIYTLKLMNSYVDFLIKAKIKNYFAQDILVNSLLLAKI